MEIPKKLRHIPPQRIVYDGLFAGAHDTNLSRQTAGYVARCCGSRAQYNFPYSTVAPKAQITAGATWTTFTHAIVVSCDFDVPWYHQTQMAGIRAIVRLASPSRTHAQVRLYSDDLIDAVAQTAGDGVRSVSAFVSPFHYWNSKHWLESWSARGATWRISSHVCYIESPTVPANRRFALTPQVMIPADADVLLGTGGKPEFYIESLFVEDVFSIDEGA